MSQDSNPYRKVPSRAAIPSHPLVIPPKAEELPGDCSRIRWKVMSIYSHVYQNYIINTGTVSYSRYLTIVS